MADALWRRLLGQAWAGLDRAELDRAGLDREAADGAAWTGGLGVTGEPGQLPSRLPVEDVAIACVGVALLAAAALHAGRGGEEWRELRLDRRHVAAAVRSEAWVRVNGEPAGAGFAPLSRFWRAGGGWGGHHAHYPPHREALLRALRCGEDPEAVAAAIAGLGAVEVEDLVTGAGGVAAAVRTEADWRASPAGQAVAAARLVE